MNKISRYSIVIILIVVSAFHIPNFYWKLFGKKIIPPRATYSPISNDFLYNLYVDRGENKYYDKSGNTYSRREYEMLLPFSFFFDLERWGVLPDTVAGYPMNISILLHDRQAYRIKSYEIHNKQIDLYPLFESESDFSGLELPAELFRIKERMEFIDAATNSIDDSLTSLFTAKLRELEFKFPARIIAGNPTTRKPFDEGYFVLDSDDNLFQIKKVKGNPKIVKTGVPADLNIHKIFISENRRKEFYGFILTHSNELYLITYDNYRLVKLPYDGYNSDSMSFFFLADPIYRTLRFSGSGHREIVVSDSLYNTVASTSVDWIPQKNTTAGKIEKFIFPFTLSTASAHNTYVNFDIEFNGVHSAFGIIISLVLCILIKYWRREEILKNWIDLVIVALSGVFGLIAVSLIKPEKWN